MKIERITAENIETWLGDIVDLGNGFLRSIGKDPKSNPTEDRAVIHTMVEAKQTEIFLAVTDDKKAVGISYFNVGTGFSCRGTYLWINGIFVLPEYQKQGFGSALLTGIEKFGESIESKLIVSSRNLGNHQSRKLFASCRYEQEEQIVITKEAKKG